MQLQINENLDLSKYQRFFAFGCSFTEFKWWTWSDILGCSFREENYFNLGLGASGNGLIFYRFIEAHKRFNITDKDLVIIEWTNPLRETRYYDEKWLLTGNITHPNQYYNQWFIDNLVDQRGYFLQTAYNISAAKLLLENIGCDWDMLSLDLDHPRVSEHADIMDLFSEEFNCIKPSFHNLLNDFKFENRLDEFADDERSNQGKDYHPTPLMHLEYLNKIYNFKLSPYVKEQIDQSNRDALSGKMKNEPWELAAPHKKVKREMF